MVVAKLDKSYTWVAILIVAILIYIFFFFLIWTCIKAQCSWAIIFRILFSKRCTFGLELNLWYVDTRPNAQKLFPSIWRSFIFGTNRRTKDLVPLFDPKVHLYSKDYGPAAVTTAATGSAKINSVNRFKHYSILYFIAKIFLFRVWYKFDIYTFVLTLLKLRSWYSWL